MARRVTLLFIALAVAFALPAIAHSGGTDKNGCHTNKKTGDFHCHGSSKSTSGSTSTRSAAPSTSTEATYFTPSARTTKPRAAMSAKPGTSPASAPSVNLVKATQNLLRVLGHEVELGGVLTPNTKLAVVRIQREEKLTPTGVPDELLLVRLTQRVREMHLRRD